MKNLEYLVGDSKIYKDVSEPYNTNIINLLSDLSYELNNKKYYKSYSDIKTLSFFCRKANLLNLKKKSKNYDDQPRLGLGLVFHVTPSNIPTNFFYSLIFGLINGNSNIVKVPSKNFEQIDIICKVLNKLLLKLLDIAITMITLKTFHLIVMQELFGEVIRQLKILENLDYNQDQ